jgi:hypothetical protein
VSIFQNGRTPLAPNRWKMNLPRLESAKSGLPDGILFKPKIQIWVNFGGSCNGRCWYILWTFGPFYGHLVHFTDIWYILCLFGIFCGNLE